MIKCCFDPKLASSPARVVPVARVIDLLMVTHASDRVEQYREAMLRGDNFPPISVLPLLRWFLVTDGHKRLTAYKSLSTSEILVQTWTLRRSLMHLGQQTWKEASQASRIVRDLGRDPHAPGQLKKFLWSRVRHYQRLGRSLWLRISGT